MLDKAAVLAALRAHIAANLDSLRASQRGTQEGATHEEARPEHAKDTRATEASYLARGLAQRVSDLEDAARLLETLALRPFAADAPVALSALVTAEEDGRSARYFLAPTGAGIELAVAGHTVVVVTPRSPLGRSLLGKRAGDEVAIRTPRGTRVLELLAVD